MISTSNVKAAPSIKEFGLKDKIGYMFGDFGNDFFFIFASSFLMVYYTDVLGINPALAGVIFLVARFWDAIMDVLWGRFIDSRPATKNGKFKPWILKCAPMLVLFGILMFAKIPGMSNQFYVVYALATYIIWGSLYSTVNIPYGSMASVITGDATERSSLSTFRSVGATIAGVIVGVVVPMVVFINNKPSSGRFFITAVIFAILAMASYSLCYFLSTERVTKEEDPKNRERLNMGVTLKSLVKNKPFIVIVIASLILIVAMLLQGAVNTYLFKDYFHNTKALSMFNLLGVLSIVIVAPAVAPLTRKFGKKEAAAAGLLFSSIVYFLLSFSNIQNVNLFIVLMFIGNLGFYFFNFTIWAFVTDVIDYQEYLTGKREDGTVYSIYSFARKVGQALAGGIGGFALGAIGYVAKAPQQSPEVALKIKHLALLSPAAGYFIIFLILALAYPMSRERLAQLSKDLAAKRASK